MDSIDTQAILDACARSINEALETYEMQDRLDIALAVYQDVDARLESLDLTPGDPSYSLQQSVLAFCLMRIANILRQQGKDQDAAQLSLREIAAARASQDDLTLGRSLMSYSIACYKAQDIEQGSQYMDEARQAFSQSDAYEYQQGLGWTWIIAADLINAGLLPGGPAEILPAATRALDILLPLDNYPGIARAYAVRAKAYTKLGRTDESASDQQNQAKFEQLTREHGASPN